MTAYKSKFTFVGLAVAAIFTLLLFTATDEGLDGFIICSVIVISGLLWALASYKWRFITADDYMQIDSIIYKKRIDWKDVIVIESTKYQNGGVSLRIISKQQKFDMPVYSFRKNDSIAINRYLEQQAKKFAIPFNYDIPYFKSAYYKYNPKPIATLSAFWPPLLPKTRIWIFGAFVPIILGLRIGLKNLERTVALRPDIQLLWMVGIILLISGWLHLLFAQFPQNLRSIDQPQRGHEQELFVPTATSAQPYRLPFVLVSVVLGIAIAGFIWYLTR